MAKGLDAVSLPHFLVSLLLSWAGADWARLRGEVAGTILKR